MNRDRVIEDVLRLWGLQLKKIHEDIPIAGSQDRCLFRAVIEDREGKLFILENLDTEFVPHKKRIAQALAYLSEKGLAEVRTYLALGENKYIATWRTHHWQVSPYVDGIPLERPDYAFQGWRGPVFSNLSLPSGSLGYQTG